jgi:hypothetical protein
MISQEQNNIRWPEEETSPPLPQALARLLSAKAIFRGA